MAVGVGFCVSAVLPGVHQEAGRSEWRLQRVGSEGEEECGAGEKSSSGQLERIQGQLGAPWAFWQALCMLPVLFVREG